MDFEALLLGDVAVPRGSPLCFLSVKVCCAVVMVVVSLLGSALSLRSLTARNWARSRAWTSGWTANAMATPIRVGLTTSPQRGALHARTRASQARIYEFRYVRDREVPFQSSGHGTGELDADRAAEWLCSAFGRGGAGSNLADHKLVAESALVSRTTVQRAQSVVAHSLHRETCEVMSVQ